MGTDYFDKPGFRLVTQNLLTSAALIGRSQAPDWESIRDLSVLIDLFCLYEKIVVLGRESGVAIDRADSALMDLLRTSDFVKVDDVDPITAEKVAEETKKHLLAFLETENVEPFLPILKYALNPPAIEFGLCYEPDRERELTLGSEWLRTSPYRRGLLEDLRKEADTARSTTFLLRSFLYLSYSIVTHIVFTPDTVRIPVLQTISESEKQLRAKLLARMGEAWKSYPENDLANLKRQFTPLAAVVFQRAYPNPKRVIIELKALRDELAPLRKRLNEAENAMLYGERANEVGAYKKWENVIEELGRSFGKEPYLVSLEQVLNFGEDMAEMYDDSNKMALKTSAILGLPLEVMKRLVARRGAIELHDLRRELPGIGSLRKQASWLFGVQ